MFFKSLIYRVASYESLIIISPQIERKKVALDKKTGIFYNYVKGKIQIF